MRLFVKILLLTISSVLPYIFSLNGEFVFDDSEAIINNPDLKLENSYKDVFFHDFWGTDILSNVSHKSYRPLTILSFRLNRLWDGDRLIARNFKITNLVLHVAVTILLYHLLSALFKNVKKRCSNQHCLDSFITTNRNLWKDEPFLSSLLFAVQPVHVEAVSGIVGRADVLSALFFLTSIFFYYEIIKSSHLKITHWINATFFALLATISKEIGITVLGMCMIFDTLTEFNPKFINLNKELNYYKVNNIKIKSMISYLNLKKHFIARQVLILCTIILFLYLRSAVMNFTIPTFHDIDNPAAFSDTFTRITTHNYIYFLNALIFIWPEWLCFDWSMGCIPLINSIYDIRILFIIIFWGGLSALFYKMYLKNTCSLHQWHFVISLTFLILPFLPASNIIMPVGFVIAERILYISSIGFSILVVKGLSRLICISSPYYQKVIKIMFVSLLLINGLRTFERSHEWMNEKYLYNSALKVCPLNAKVHYNIAKNAGDSNNIDLAEVHYKEAIKLYPNYYQAMNNLANLFKDQARFSEAKWLLSNALEIKKDFPAAWMNLGIVLANLKRPAESEEAYLMAIKYRKNYSDCYYNLGNLYLESKKFELALQAWAKATEINPKHAVAWSNTFALLDNTRQFDRALQLVPMVLAQIPHSPAIHFNIANLLGKKEQFYEAEKYFIKAIELQNATPSALYYTNLGVLYHRWKKNDLAKQMYEKALSIDPYYISAKDNLRKLIV